MDSAKIAWGLENARPGARLAIELLVANLNSLIDAEMQVFMMNNPENDGNHDNNQHALKMMNNPENDGNHDNNQHALKMMNNPENDGNHDNNQHALKTLSASTEWKSCHEPRTLAEHVDISNHHTSDLMNSPENDGCHNNNRHALKQTLNGSTTATTTEKHNNNHPSNTLNGPTEYYNYNQESTTLAEHVSMSNHESNVVGQSSSHGLNNYLYNIFDQWTEVAPESTTLNASTECNNYCHEPRTLAEHVDISNHHTSDLMNSPENNGSHNNNQHALKDLENVQPNSSLSNDDDIEAVDDVNEWRKIKLVQIGRSNNYADEEGYLYTKNNTRTSVNSYFRCKNCIRHKCKTRVVAEKNDMLNAKIRTEHTHKPKKRDLDKEKFDKALDEMANENVLLKPLQLYLKTKKKLINEIDTKNVPSPKSKETFIRNRKRKRVPKLPKTISDFIEIMNDGDYSHYSFDEHESIFYRGVWEIDGNSNIVYISQRVLDQLNTMDCVVLFMDGTFKILPRHFRQRFRQLYVISIIYRGRCYPLAFILMQKKDFKSYDMIFNRIKLMFPSVCVSGCMSDYEPAIRKALIKHFPTARICGCFFHYVQAIHKAFKRFGMLNDEKFEEALQEVSALALLPNDFIKKGFNAIDQKMGVNSIRWNKFRTYWLKQWLNANISVYGLSDRTNNFSESLNNTINSLNGRRPSIWELLSNLKLIEMQKSDELENHVAGEMKTTIRSKGVIRLDQKIMNATNLFNKDKDVVMFLKRITFDEKLEEYFKERIWLNGVDKEDDFDDDFDEEIIPNWFNTELTLIPQTPKRKAVIHEKVNAKKRQTVV